MLAPMWMREKHKVWSDKMQALASYARQADDDTLHKMAVRIQSRAIRRCGELLKQFDARGVEDHPVNVESGFQPVAMLALPIGGRRLRHPFVLAGEVYDGHGAGA